MARLIATADPSTWVAVTESFGFRGRRHRKAALRMLMTQANAALGVEQRGSGRFAAWAMSQAAPALMRRANGRVLAWAYKKDPELVVAMATIQQATPQMRAARAMRPMEYDDTETFQHPTLGAGERLVLDAPDGSRPPFVTYTWDLQSTFIELTAVCGDPARFRMTLGDIDELARSIRVADDLSVGEKPETLRIDPA